MKRPAKVDVLGQTFKIEYRKATEPLFTGDEEVTLVGHVAMGYCDAVEQTIVVRDDTAIGRDAARDTLLHETLHAVFALTGLSEEPWLTERRAESVVARVSPVLLHVLRSNPDLLSYLLRRKTTDEVEA